MPAAEITSLSPEETGVVAAALAGALRPGDTMLLTGDLGAGKTTLIRALVAALGVDRRAVSSPTFVLANEYIGAGGLRIVHIDAYRLGGSDAEELELLGWDRLATADAIILVEWADRIEHLIDRPAVRLGLEHAGEHARRITIETPPAWADRVLPDFGRAVQVSREAGSEPRL